MRRQNSVEGFTSSDDDSDQNVVEDQRKPNKNQQLLPTSYSNNSNDDIDNLLQDTDDKNDNNNNDNNTDPAGNLSPDTSQNFNFNFRSIRPEAKLAPVKFSRTIVDKNFPDGAMSYTVHGGRWYFDRKYERMVGTNLQLIQGTIEPKRLSDNHDDSSSKNSTTAPLRFKLFSASDGFNSFGDYGTQVAFRIVSEDGPIHVLNIGQHIAGDARIRDGHYYWKPIESSKDVKDVVLSDAFAKIGDDQFVEDDDPKLQERIKKHTCPAHTVPVGDNKKKADTVFASTHDYFEAQQSSAGPTTTVARSTTELYANNFAKMIGASSMPKETLYFLLDGLLRRVQRQYDSEEEERDAELGIALPLAVQKAYSWFVSNSVDSECITSDFEKLAKAL